MDGTYQGQWLIRSQKSRAGSNVDMESEAEVRYEQLQKTKRNYWKSVCYPSITIVSFLRGGCIYKFPHFHIKLVFCFFF